jgi:hypothetical protein
MKIKKWLYEEIVAAEEITSKDDIQPFLLKIKKVLLGKSFSQDQVTVILHEFLKQVNASGYLAKIEKNDSSVKDVTVNIQGSDLVIFTVTSDDDIRDKKSFSIKVPAGSKEAVNPNINQQRQVLPASRVDTAVHGSGYKLGAAKKPGEM